MTKKEVNFLIVLALLLNLLKAVFIFEAWLIHSLVCKKDHNHGN